MAERMDTGRQEAFWTPGRIVATAVVGGLVAAIGYTIFAGRAEFRTDSNVVLPGAALDESGSAFAPPDFEIPTLAGDSIRLSAYRGMVVVLDFWATWCAPCRQEIPQLVRIAKQNRERGLEVIGLHIDDRGRSSEDDIRRFVSHYSVNYTVGRASDEVFTAYLGETETSIPQTLVFDRSGKVVAHLIGYTADDADRLDEAINRALSGP